VKSRLWSRIFAQSLWLSNCGRESSTAIGKTDKRSWNRRTELYERRQSDRSCTKMTPNNVRRVDALTLGDGHTVIACSMLSISTKRVMFITENFALFGVCVLWVPKILRWKKRQGKHLALKRYRMWGIPATSCHDGWKVGPSFLPKSKRQSMEWRHTPTKRKITFNNVPSAQKSDGYRFTGGRIGGIRKCHSCELLA
jgi:hypothetical protein